MTAEKDTAENAKKRDEKGSQNATSKEPDWADGLRQLYDSVVDEPLPDSFKDLLSQLDDTSQSS